MMSYRRYRRLSAWQRRIYRIFYKVMRWLIWIVLGILGTALCLLLLPFLLILLFAPIRYSVDTKLDTQKHAGEGIDNIVSVRVRYLFGLFRLIYDYPTLAEGDSGGMSIKIAEYVLAGKSDDSTINNKENHDDLKPAEQNTDSDTAINTDFAGEKKQEKDEKNNSSDDNPESFSQKTEKIKNNLKKLLNTANTVLTYPHRKTIMELILVCFKKYRRILIPKHLKINGEIGFSDPSRTGIFFGVYGVIVSILEIQSIRLQAVFDIDETILRLDADIRGSITIAGLTWPLLWLAWKEPVRGLIIKHIFKR